MYHVSNESISASFRGDGTVCDYQIANGPRYVLKNAFLTVDFNGTLQDVMINKTVYMLGRRQIVHLEMGHAVLVAEMFLDKKEKGIFQRFSLLTENESDVATVALTGYDFGTDYTCDKNILAGMNMMFSCLPDFSYCQENESIILSVSKDHPVCCFFSFGETMYQAEYCIDHFDHFREDCAQEIAQVRVPEGLDETEKALFYSCYFCALENYKELDDYKGFMAGCNYLSPMRTYYRDSFFTVLPMYNGNSDKIKNQIHTLAAGIGEDGTCPSAVKWDWSAFWGNHYDSPSFLSIMLYDYVRHTGDVSILKDPSAEVTVFEQALRALEKLSESTDTTGLLYKEGIYNKRDWADEVNRYGYVTYDEVLYARALYSVGKLYDILDEREKSAWYIKRFHQVRDAINALLWDESLGYYVNFKNKDYTEKNLSIDTVLAVLFDIADNERSVSMLKKMEQMLETQNNGAPEDFGSMCVYPFYSKQSALYRKSSQSYNYHNGANWPYWTAMYACAKRKHAMPYRYLLTGWFEYNLNKGNFTPIEYFSPFCADGSALQAWSGNSAFVLDGEISINFWD